MLVFGDAHIPSRRDSIPEAFYSRISDTPYDLALVTGDLTREHDMRKALPPLPRTIIVRGNMDYYSSESRHHEQLRLGAFDVLLIHGTQLRPRGNIKQLWEIATTIGADIGIHGHTHTASIDLFKEKLFLNPGTISGATGGWVGRQEASFIELDIDDAKISVTLFKSDWNVQKTSTLAFTIEDGCVKRSSS